jgi:polar amino acid transport system substrate-binding protein
MELTRRTLVSLVGMGGVAAGLTAPRLTRSAYAQAAGGDSIERVVKSGQLRVAHVIWPPFSIKDPQSGTLSGHYVEAINWICEGIKVKPVFVEAQWGTFIATLQAGQADLSIAATYATIQRATAVDFSDPTVYLGINALVTKKFAKPYKRVEEIDQKGLRIIIEDGTGPVPWVRATYKQATVTTFAPGTDPNTAVLDVLAGRADMFVNDDYIVTKLAKQHSAQLAPLMPVPFNLTPIAWAVRKGDQAMLNFLNVALRQIQHRRLDIEWEKKVGADWVHDVPNYVSTNRL